MSEQPCGSSPGSVVGLADHQFRALTSSLRELPPGENQPAGPLPGRVLTLVLVLVLPEPCYLVLATPLRISEH